MYTMIMFLINRKKPPKIIRMRNKLNSHFLAATDAAAVGL